MSDPVPFPLANDEASKIIADQGAQIRDLAATVAERDEKIRRQEARIGAYNNASLVHEATIEELKARFDRLNAQLTETNQRLTESYATNQRRAQAHEKDIALIGERMIQEARNRGWCNSFDEIIEELNRSLTVQLPTLERTYTVTVDITVNARSEDDARNAVSRELSGNEFEDYNISDVSED